jgi:hypothetical protein
MSCRASPRGDWGALGMHADSWRAAVLRAGGVSKRDSRWPQSNRRQRQQLGDRRRADCRPNEARSSTASRSIVDWCSALPRAMINRSRPRWRDMAGSLQASRPCAPRNISEATIGRGIAGVVRVLGCASSTRNAWRHARDAGANSRRPPHRVLDPPSFQCKKGALPLLTSCA